jgi:hypothetical protein
LTFNATRQWGGNSHGINGGNSVGGDAVGNNDGNSNGSGSSGSSGGGGSCGDEDITATAMAGVTDNNQPKLAAEEMLVETAMAMVTTNKDGKNNDGSDDNAGGCGVHAQ